ncbi:MAG: hypothetical protein ACJA1A_000987 [Saprospiraceae bacterium]
MFCIHFKASPNGRLNKSCRKAKARIENRSRLAKYEVLKHNLNLIGDQNTKVAIPGANAYEFVKIEDIIRCEGWQKYPKYFSKMGMSL